MEEQQDGRPVSWRQLLTGVVVGWILSWVAFFLAIMVVLSVAYDSGSAWVSVLVWGALFAPAVIVGVIALVRRSRGQVVAGMLVGLAIGSILGAGVCTGWSVTATM